MSNSASISLSSSAPVTSSSCEMRILRPASRKPMSKSISKDFSSLHITPLSALRAKQILACRAAKPNCASKSATRAVICRATAPSADSKTPVVSINPQMLHIAQRILTRKPKQDERVNPEFPAISQSCSAASGYPASSLSAASSQSLAAPIPSPAPSTILSSDSPPVADSRETVSPSSNRASPLSNSVSEGSISSLASSPAAATISKEEILKCARTYYSEKRYAEAIETFTRVLSPAQNSMLDLQALRGRADARFNLAAITQSKEKATEYLKLALKDNKASQKLVLEISSDLISLTCQMGGLLYDKHLIHFRLGNYPISLEYVGRSYNQYERYLSELQKQSEKDMQAIDFAEVLMKRCIRRMEKIANIIKNTQCERKA